LANLLSEVEFLPKATFYETVKLNLQEQPRYQSVTLVPDTSYDYTYYAYHAAGIHIICMQNWIENLRDLSNKFEQGQDAKQELSSWLKEKTTSDIRVLVNSSPFSNGFVPIVGLAIFDDVYLSYSMVALSSEYQAVTRELQFRPVSNSIVSESAMKQQLEKIGDDEEDDEKYRALLPLPAYQPPKALETASKQPKVIIPADMSGSKEVVINEETLRFFSKSTQQIRTEGYHLRKAAFSIQKR
jgi:nucleoporin NUP82